MSGGGATLPDAYCSQWKVQLVIDHEQVLLRINFVLVHQLQHRQAGEVHISLRLGQQHFFFADPGPRCKRLAVPVLHHHSALISNAVNGEKPDVVRRELIFDSRIAKTNEQFHVVCFLPSRIAEPYYQFHALTRSTSCPQVTSCLPCLLCLPCLRLRESLPQF